MSNYKIFIPTRDSANWLGQLVLAYKKRKISPIFIVDSRSIDDTINILKTNEMEYYEYLPEGDYVEAGMIEFGSRVINSTWALRLDDDEFPSQKLIDKLDDLCSSKIFEAWYISRREVYEFNKKFVYSRWPSRIQYFINTQQHPGIIEVLQPFPRLYKTSSVDYIKTVHSAGFKLPSRVGYLENDIFFVHFQGLVKTPEQRLAKVRKYAAVGEAHDAWAVTDEYLIEYLDKELFDFSDSGMGEFEDLFISVRNKTDKILPNLTNEEKNMMSELLLKSSLSSRHSFNQKINLLNKKMEIYVEIDRSYLKHVPKMMTKKLSELFYTLSRQTGSLYLRKKADLLWKINHYRSEDKG